ncbi:twin-arginine translocation signal domain-containing protein, partial [Salmonella enterica subsp. enterica serovar 4:-:1,2]|nr:twin-arginine translocation signal domain-containing protein [Salmonella enterica subsp. enterica serovar 4:-:1,2]
MTDRSKKTSISRRSLLKGAAGVAGLAGSGTLLSA